MPAQRRKPEVVDAARREAFFQGLPPEVRAAARSGNLAYIREGPHPGGIAHLHQLVERAGRMPDRKAWAHTYFLAIVPSGRKLTSCLNNSRQAAEIRGAPS